MTDKIKAANQRLVNESYAHIHKTCKQSIFEGSCVYGGSGCAFRPALRNEESVFIEADKIVLLTEIFSNHKSLLNDWAKDIDPMFAIDIQGCHDKWDSRCPQSESFLDYFDKQLFDLCKMYDLTFPEKHDANI